MKKVLLSIILFMSVIAVNAQNSGSSSNSPIKKTGDGFCNCITQSFKSLELHPAIYDMLRDISKYGKEEAQNNLVQKMMKMTPEEQQQIAKDADKMQSFSYETLFETPACQELKNMGVLKNPTDDFKNKLLAYLKSKDGCEIAHMILLQGFNQKTQGE